MITLRRSARGEATGEGSGIAIAFRHPVMARLLAAFGLVTVGEWATVTSLSIYVFKLSGTLAVGFVGFRFVPGALSSMLFAPLVERHRGVLARIALARTLLLGAAAAWVLLGYDASVVIALIAIDAAVAAPYRTAQSRILPVLSREPEELAGATAGISVMKTVGQAGGGLAGGVLAAVVDPGAVMAGGAVAMATAAFLGSGLQPARQRAVSNWLAVLRDGFAAVPQVLRDGRCSAIVIASVARTFVRGLWMALAVVVALRLFHLGSSGVGLLQAAAGIGAVVGIPITAKLIGRQRLGIPCAVAFVAAGVAVGVVGIFDFGESVAFVVIAWGTAMAVADATSLSLLYRLLHSDTLSRVVGVMEALKLASEGIGALMAPALVAIFGLRTALIVAGAPLPLVVLASLGQIRRSDLAASGRSALVRLLHSVRVLRILDMASLEDVAARVVRTEVGEGEIVMRQGDPGDRFYVIERGEVEVEIGGYPVARLSRGAGFGERALLRDSPRSATIRALSDLDLWSLERDDFLMAMTGQRPDEADEAARPLRAYAPDIGSRPLAEVLGDLSQLAGASRERLEEVAAATTTAHYAPGAVVIREGETADSVFVVLAGVAEVTVGGKATARVHPGDAFGEIAVLHSTPRTATVTALEPLTVCRVPAEDYLAAVTVRPTPLAKPSG
ncbi:MAG TPA: cyclic nucleotide-binding domain-containing protein [Solirubrobacteraceae bacterium]|nr:cyclic nucleotide-binding domain-containing protein [Solirubrobacteraceae bacterium]